MSFATPPATMRRATVPLAPLLDVLFLLLIFFATTSSYRAFEQQISVNLPLSQTAGADEPAPNEVLVNIQPTGALVVNGKTVSLVELKNLLGELARDYPNDRLIIRGDKSVEYGRVIAVMDVARAAGMNRISFATVRSNPGGE